MFHGSTVLHHVGIALLTTGIVPSAIIAVVLYLMKPKQERMLDIDVPTVHMVEDALGDDARDDGSPDERKSSS